MSRRWLLFALLLGGCASQVMQGFVGHPLQSVMARRGPPSNAFDMPNGRRAFQWSITNTYVMPAYATNSGNAYAIGNQVWWTQNTQISGGQPITGECIYTLYARWSPGANAWLIESFERPSLMCE